MRNMGFYEKLDEIEKAHNDFLRKITIARKSTSLYMLYGETVRYSLEIVIKSRLNGYWNRLLHSKRTKNAFLIYQCLLHTVNAPSKWVNHIRSILNQIGRPDIWISQQNIRTKSLAQLTKRTLVEQFIQEWRGKRVSISESIHIV